MLTSINILIIKSIDVETDMGGFQSGFSEVCIMQYKSILNARLEFTHPITNKCFSELIITSTGYDMDAGIAIRNCIEAFINKQFESGLRFHTCEGCDIDKSGVHGIIIEIDDPRLRKLFTDVFDIKNWSLHDKTLTC